LKKKIYKSLRRPIVHPVNYQGVTCSLNAFELEENSQFFASGIRVEFFAPLFTIAPHQIITTPPLTHGILRQKMHCWLSPQ